MTFGSRSKTQIVVWVVFAVYAGVLIKVILFKNSGALQLLLGSAARLPLSVRMRELSNFTPFRTIVYYASGYQSTGVAVRNLAGNIFAFSPMGFLLPILLPRRERVMDVIVVSLGVSLLFEITQLLTSLGQFDVDDALLNVFGATIGWLAYWGMRRLLYRREDQIGGGAS